MASLGVAPIGRVVFGSNEAAAAATGALFLVLAVLAFVGMALTRYRVYVLLTASGLLRGIGLILRACAVHQLNPDIMAGFYALTAAGYGMAIGVVCLVLISWYRNAALWGQHPEPRSRFAVLAAAACRAGVPVVILCGPVLGVVGAVLIYGVGSPSSLLAAVHVRQASAWGMWCIIVLAAAFATIAAAASLRSAVQGSRNMRAADSAEGGPWRSADLLVLLLLPAAICLVIAACQRVAATIDPSMLDESVYYPMAVLPELISMLLLAAVPGLLARIGMCGNYQRHLQSVGRAKPQLSANIDVAVGTGGGAAGERGAAPKEAQADAAIV